MKQQEPLELIDKRTKKVVAIIYLTHQETIVHRVKNRKSDIVIEDLKSTIEKAQYENLKNKYNLSKYQCDSAPCCWRYS